MVSITPQERGKWKTNSTVASIMEKSSFIRETYGDRWQECILYNILRRKKLKGEYISNKGGINSISLVATRRNSNRFLGNPIWIPLSQKGQLGPSLSNLRLLLSPPKIIIRTQNLCILLPSFPLLCNIIDF